MGSRLSHAAIEELLGAYALDALDRDEITKVEAHLDECPRCRDEVAQHRETAACLARSGGLAPEGVWLRIAAELAEAPPMVAPVVPIGARRAAPATSASRNSRLFPFVASVAAVAAAISLVLAVKVVNQEKHLRQLDSALVSSGMDQVAEAALLHPNSRKVDLRSGDGSQWATAVVLPNGQGYVVRDQLAKLPDDRTYQLWGSIGGETVSLGLLGNDPEVVAFTVAPDTLLLALTNEPAGGVVKTAKPPVATGIVPS